MRYVWDLDKRSIHTVLGIAAPPHRDGYLLQARVSLRAKARCLYLPNGQLLTYHSTDREGYRQYPSDREQCSNRPVGQKWAPSANITQAGTRHAWEAGLEWIDQHRLSRVGERIYKRKETVERALPTLSNCTETATPGARPEPKCNSNACSPPPCGTSRKSPRCLAGDPQHALPLLQALLSVYGSLLSRYQLLAVLHHPKS